jgi:predicted PurR-regulated permease PerM
MQQRLHVEITWNTLWRIFLFALAALLVVRGRDVLIGLFLALIISSGLDFFVNFFEKRGVPRTLSVIVLFLLAALLVALVGYVLIPSLIVNLNLIISRYDAHAAAYWLGPFLNFNGSRSFTVLLNHLSNDLLGGGNGVQFGTFSTLFHRIGLGIAVIVISFYLSLSRDGVERFIRSVLPDQYENAALTIYRRSRRKVGTWLRTQVALSLLVGFLTWITLFLLGVDNALVLACLTGILELVPFVGPVIAGTIAVLLTLTTSPGLLALYVLIAFLVIHQLEAHVFVPLLTGRSVGLHPVIVIVALFIGFEAAGLIGAVIAVPAAAVLQEVFEELASRKRAPNVPLPLPTP